VDPGSVYFVLQLLVHSPPFWNLFRGLCDLKGQHGARVPETPLVDATVRFFEEFTFKKKEPPPTQQLPQQATRERPDEDEEDKDKVMDPFEPTYMYDALKEKRQLKKLLVGSRAQNAPFVTDPWLHIV
jgi:hypothetical protein